MNTPETVAARMGVSVHTVRSWLQRERIPLDRWSDFVVAGCATLEELHASAPPRKSRAA